MKAPAAPHQHLRILFAGLASSGSWYRLELDRHGYGQCVRLPLSPSRQSVWVKPVPTGPGLPQIKIAPTLRDPIAAWQDIPVSWRPALVRSVLLLQRYDLPAVLVEQRRTSSLTSYSVSFPTQDW